ncbi:CUN073 putative p47 transcription regulator factor, similar to AcMNPV ORF40 [Culex nigripalpus nucleopolyhedrovirus]|uniref:CUN073 putative p47 transcription regulator factor, similar to AcMNPV ORF40 n=2 Tax=Deltabaculovirus TaxID=558019 RepID=Q919K3_NPVCO|nr:CUN073 putative p47 transcription regulator factor, similar to AcMNPV ORF40 [Culex nigripalpus nucleopolyhedrovirus]AAK94151.1 CUN073 putative p47 transcription regulator factor, similar to AcMNPV ORF40 [Culex nigripalpus nucleopolyhedrovirus]
MKRTRKIASANASPDCLDVLEHRYLTVDLPSSMEFCAKPFAYHVVAVHGFVDVSNCALDVTVRAPRSCIPDRIDLEVNLRVYTKVDEFFAALIRRPESGHKSDELCKPVLGYFMEVVYGNRLPLTKYQREKMKLFVMNAIHQCREHLGYLYRVHLKGTDALRTFTEHMMEITVERKLEDGFPLGPNLVTLWTQDFQKALNAKRHIYGAAGEEDTCGWDPEIFIELKPAALPDLRFMTVYKNHKKRHPLLVLETSSATNSQIFANYCEERGLRCWVNSRNNCLVAVGTDGVNLDSLAAFLDSCGRPIRPAFHTNVYQFLERGRPDLFFGNALFYNFYRYSGRLTVTASSEDRLALSFITLMILEQMQLGGSIHPHTMRRDPTTDPMEMDSMRGGGLKNATNGRTIDNNKSHRLSYGLGFPHANGIYNRQKFFINCDRSGI